MASVLATASLKMFTWLKLCAFQVAKALVTSGSKNMLLWLMIDLCVPSNQITIKLSIVTPSQLPDVCKFESDAVANGVCVSYMESIRACYTNAKSDPGSINVASAKLLLTSTWNTLLWLRL